MVNAHTEYDGRPHLKKWNSDISPLVNEWANGPLNWIAVHIPQ